MLISKTAVAVKFYKKNSRKNIYLYKALIVKWIKIRQKYCKMGIKVLTNLIQVFWNKSFIYNNKNGTKLEGKCKIKYHSRILQ